MFSVADLLAESPKVRVGEKDLPLTIAGYNGILAKGVVLWDGTISPPFLNREDSLLALLNIAYQNWTIGSDKPTIVMKATTPGSGKTRLLFEWPIRAFTYPNVLRQFCEQDGITRVPPRQQFLNDLWATVHQQRIIVFTCSDIPKDIEDKGW